jgi:uncharacterized protein YbbK (DUF523 family)
MDKKEKQTEVSVCPQMAFATIVPNKAYKIVTKADLEKEHRRLMIVMPTGGT